MLSGGLRLVCKRYTALMWDVKLRSYAGGGMARLEVLLRDRFEGIDQV